MKTAGTLPALPEAALAATPDKGYLNPMRFHPGQLAAVLSLAAAVAGCKKEEIQVYQAPKDIAAPAPVAAANPAAGETRGERPPWTVPAGWTEKPREAGSMRIASYGVTTADGRSADISVVPLGPVAGTELENVNRWRTDFTGIAKITEEELPTVTTEFLVDMVKAYKIDFRGPGGSGATGGAMRGPFQGKK